MPTISVIVPVYKVSAYLSRCVESILAQTYSDFELILVDDESPDDCPKMCDNYGEMDKRVHVLHIPHGGLSVARNAGIAWTMEYSDSQFLSFVDSDDWVHPRYLEWLYGAVQRGNITMAVGNYVMVSDTCVFDDKVSISTITPEQLYGQNIVNFIVAWGKLYQKEVFRNLRFPLGKVNEDEFTTWKILFKYDAVALINTPIYAYFQRPDSIIGTWSPKRLVRIEAVKEQLEWIMKNGNAEMLTKAKQRLANVYAEEIKGMVQYGMPAQSIREYRKELRGHIKNIRKEFPIVRYRTTYEMAWPIETRTICFIHSLLSKVKHRAIRIVKTVRT